MLMMPYVVTAIMFITVVVALVFSFLFKVENFYIVRRTKLTHPHQNPHKREDFELKSKHIQSYIYNRLASKNTPAKIRKLLVEKGWSEIDAHDYVKHYTEKYLRDKKAERKRVAKDKLLIRKKK